MVKIDDVDLYISGADIPQNGTLMLPIIDEAEYEVKFMNGKEKRMLSVPVEHKGKEYHYTPNGASKRILMKALSDETENWVGAVLEVYKKDKMIGGEKKEVIYIKGIVPPARAK